MIYLIEFTEPGDLQEFEEWSADCLPEGTTVELSRHSALVETSNDLADFHFLLRFG